MLKYTIHVIFIRNKHCIIRFDIAFYGGSFMTALEEGGSGNWDITFCFTLFSSWQTFYQSKGFYMESSSIKYFV